MSTPSRSAQAPPDGRDVRWAAHRIARRRELVDAALRAIRRHGAGVGMDEIAAEAGTSKTVIYRHLGDRLGLYLAVCESVDARILGDIDAAARASTRGVASAREVASSRSSRDATPHDSAAGRGAASDHDAAASAAPEPAVLSAVIDSYLRLVERDPEVYRFVVRRPDVTLPDGPDAADPVTGLSGRIADNLYALLVTLDDTPEAQGRARAYAWGIVGLVKESADRWLENPDGLTRGDLARHLADLAYSGLRGALTASARQRGTDAGSPAQRSSAGAPEANPRQPHPDDDTI